jgi:alpha/beta superfamily hydrolase
VSAAPAPRPQYLDAPDGALFSVFHAPAAAARESLPAVIFCAPWGWNEAVSYHARREWAEALADEGHPVLRFDLPAVGDSAGAPDEAGLLGRWIDAVGTAARWLRGAAPGRELVALGLELGGLLATEAARAGAPIDALALWATPRDGRGFVRLTQAFSRMQAWDGSPDGDSPLPDGWIEAGGFVLSADTVAALKAVKPAELEAPRSVRRALVLGREDAPADATLIKHLEEGGTSVESGPGEGWDVLIAHPSYAVVRPEVRERISRWLRAGKASTSPIEAPSRATPTSAEFAVGGTTIRETPLDYLPPDTFGILAEPADAAAAIEGECTLLFNAGNVRHIGPNRIWVDASREMAATGTRTLRIDLAGIGEADGESARFVEVSEFYEPEFGAQALAIMDALETAGVASRFKTVGLCSGGYWAYRTALNDSRVSAALLLNPGALRWRASLVMERDGKGIGMLFRPRPWKKLLRGEYDLKKIRTFGQLVVRRLTERFHELGHATGGAGADGVQERDPGLEAELDSLRESGTGLTLAFSADEMDKELEAMGILAQRERWPNLQVHGLPGVDHALASTSAQSAARGLIRNF